MKKKRILTYKEKYYLVGISILSECNQITTNLHRQLYLLSFILINLIATNFCVKIGGNIRLPVGGGVVVVVVNGVVVLVVGVGSGMSPVVVCVVGAVHLIGMNPKLI